ncbi:MAG: hypothetical protein ACLPN6_15620 [Streptosporangiaceae bacterium]|nr:hypothetical protein [Actinomycetota bacterium]
MAGAAASAIITTLTAMNAVITAFELEQRIGQDFEHHPDAALARSCQPPRTYLDLHRLQG